MVGDRCNIIFGVFLFPDNCFDVQGRAGKIDHRNGEQNDCRLPILSAAYIKNGKHHQAEGDNRCNVIQQGALVFCARIIQIDAKKRKKRKRKPY
ncbi:hypothetical protein D3C80_1888270 [compost metagenome]